MIVAFCLPLSVLVFKDERFHERSGTTEMIFLWLLKWACLAKVIALLSHSLLLLPLCFAFFLKAYINMTSFLS